jgi:hypothetical protein
MKTVHLLILTLLLVGCGAAILSPDASPLEPRPNVYVPGGSFAQGVTNGLEAADRKTLYSMDEGIHWLPVDVVLAFKRSNGGFGVYDEGFFARPERLGLYPNVVDPLSDLPLGITASNDPVPMLGINCATCHTGLIANNDGAFFLVDGGSGQFATDRMVEGMVRSLAATLINPVEFDAFYERFQLRSLRRGGPARASSVEDKLNDNGLRAMVEKMYKTGKATSGLHERLRAPPSGFSSASFGAPPSPGDLSNRTKMFFYLAKRFVFFYELAQYGNPTSGANVAPSGLGRANPWAVAKKLFAAHLNYLKPGAKPVVPVVDGGPVSTPHIWDFERQKWVFWTGVTNSMLERNLAQGVSLLTDFNWPTMDTTIKIQKLESVSKLTRKVKAPTWPKQLLGDVDPSLAEKGKAIYKEKCLKCHDPKAKDQAPGSAEFNYIDVGTDRAYYDGQVELIGSYDFFSEVLASTMGRIKTRAKAVEGIPDLAPFEVGRTPVVWRKPTGPKFVAKPLAGIWATAPYLHNGSVPTLDDLLKPVKDRPTTFYVGGFLYDTKKLGFVTDPSDPRSFKFVTTEKGNSNQGHEYLVEDRLAVLEFLKSYDASTTF